MKVEVKEEKPPVQTLEKDAAILFLLKIKVLQRCKKFRHYFVYYAYSFLEAEKEPTKKRCMRMPERQFFWQTTLSESGSAIPVKANGNNLWGDSRKSVDSVSDQMFQNFPVIKVESKLHA